MLTFNEYKDYQIIEKYLDQLTDEELEEFELNGIQEDVEMCSDECCGVPVSECTCPPDCPHCDCNAEDADPVGEAAPRPKRNPNSKVMKIKRSDTMKRHREYRKNKQTIKRQQAKYRKTSAFKLYKKKRDRFKKMGRTTRGTKIRTKKVIG